MPDGKWYGEPIKIYDFKSGLYTVRAKELLPRGATPYTKSMWYDEEYALTKMPGTSLLLSEANNEFSYGECFSTWVYLTPEGEPLLIYQGMDSGNTTMSLFRLSRQSSYPAAVTPTDITPDSGLNQYRRLDYANYRGYMYITNGVDNLKRWDSETWTEYHEDEEEHFKYVCVYDGCLFQFCSARNPTRLIYSNNNECLFRDYYSSGTHWRDFPTTKGDPGMWLTRSPQGSLLIFKQYSIEEIQGSLVEDTDTRQTVSATKGTIDGRSVRILGDRVIFAWEDGWYMLGNPRIIVSSEDQKLKTEARVMPLSAEIRDLWKEKFEVPTPGEIKNITYSGYKKLTMTLTFDNGTNEIKARDVINDSGSVIGAKSATVVAISSTGDWDGSATGTLYLTNVSGAWANNDVIYIGATTSADASADISGWTYTQCVLNRAEITENPDVLNFGFDVETDIYNKHTISIAAVEDDTTDDTWVDLRSKFGKNAFFSESFKLTSGTGDDYPICSAVAIYLKEEGDISGDTVKVYITKEKSSTEAEPNFNNVYAEGSLDGDFLHGIEQLSFDTGTVEICEGMTIQNPDGGATAKGTVHKIVVTSGSWSGSDAAGELYIKSKTGTWTDNMDIYISSNIYAKVNMPAPLSGDSMPITTGCWIWCDMVYWDYPHQMYGPTYFYPVQLYLGLKTTGDDDSNYLKWSYKTSGTYSDGRMVNSDSSTPASQDTLDYNFKYYGRKFFSDNTTQVITETITADTDIDYWNEINVILDTATLEDYGEGYDNRKSGIEKIEYETKSTDAGWDWDNAIETTNGGALTGGGRYLRLRITFSSLAGDAFNIMDSFSLRKMRLSYITESAIEKTLSSEVWEDRYWMSAVIHDQGDCLDFQYDGTIHKDEVRITHNADLVPGTSDFAVEFWFKAAVEPDQDAGFVPLIGKNYGEAPQISTGGYKIEIDNYNVPVGRMRVALCVNPLQGKYVKEDVGTWTDGFDTLPHHCVLNVNRTTEVATVFIDKVSIGTIGLSALDGGSITSNALFYFGAVAVDQHSPPTAWLNGKMRHIRFYKGAELSQTHIDYDYENPTLCYDDTNLNLWIKCNEGIGETAGDSSGNDYDGSLGNGVEDNMPDWAYWDDAPSAKRAGGQMVLDKNGAIFIKQGQNILRGTSLVYFDRKLVMGVGEKGGNNYPNLVYMDKDRYQEKGIITGGTVADNTISSEWDTRVYGIESDVRKKLKRFTVVYYDDADYPNGGGDEITFQYKLDGGDWTDLKKITLARDDKTHIEIKDPGLKKEGKLWQFRVNSDYKFKVLGFEPWLQAGIQTQD